MAPEVIQAVVQRCAKRFGDSQLAQCANQISSDLMPAGAALHNYSELFTSTQAYISGMQEDVRSFVRMIGADRFSRGDLLALQEVADGNCQDERYQQVGEGTGERHQRGIEGASQAARIDPHRLRPPETDQEDRDGAERIEVIAGIRGKPTVEPGRLVTAGNRDVGVSHLVGDQPEEKGWDQIERVDDELAGIAEQHDGSKYSPKSKGPGHLRTLMNE